MAGKPGAAGSVGESMAALISALRWIAYNFAPSICPDCAGWLSPVLRRTPVELGAQMPMGDPRCHTPSDWLCCEDCDYAVALDFFDER